MGPKEQEKSATSRSAMIGPETSDKPAAWALVAVCVVLIAVVVSYHLMPNELANVKTKLDLLERRLDKLIIPHGKDCSEDIKAIEKKLDDIYNFQDNIEGLRKKVELFSANGVLIDQFEIHRNDVHHVINILEGSDRKLREDMEFLNTTLEERLVEDMKSLNTTLEERLVEDMKSLNTTLEERLVEDVKSLNTTLEGRLVEDMKSLDTTLEERLVEDMKSLYTTLEERLVKDMKSFNTTLEERLVEDMKSLNTTLEERLVEDMKSLNTTLEERLVEDMKSLNTTLEERLVEDLKSLNTTLEERLVEDMKSLNTTLEERLVEDMKSLNTTLEERLAEESDRMSGLSEKLGKIETEKATETDVIKLREEHDARIVAMESQVKVSFKEMKDKVSATEMDIDTAFDNLFDKNVAVVVIVFILAMNFGLIVAVYTLCIGSQQPHGVRQKGSNGEYYNPVLDLIPVAPALKKAIGVISFTREYQVGHRHLIRSVTDMMRGGHNIDVEYHVILKDEDIASIPRCSLIVICVEYSDRDVIIEEPGYGLGDCNKTTLASAQKIGAIPVIVYCKDLSSQRLQRNRLFNERIRCATHQKEIIPLSANNRFFSVYDDFSADQKTAFQKLITDHVLK